MAKRWSVEDWGMVHACGSTSAEVILDAMQAGCSVLVQPGGWVPVATGAEAAAAVQRGDRLEIREGRRRYCLRAWSVAYPGATVESSVAGALAAGCSVWSQPLERAVRSVREADEALGRGERVWFERRRV